MNAHAMFKRTRILDGALLVEPRYPNNHSRPALPKEKIDEVRWVSKRNGWSLLADTQVTLVRVKSTQTT